MLFLFRRGTEISVCWVYACVPVLFIVIYIVIRYQFESAYQMKVGALFQFNLRELL